MNMDKMTIGIDFSMSAPAIAFNTNDHTTDIYFTPKTIKQSNIVYESDTINIYPILPLFKQSPLDSEIERYKRTSGALMALVTEYRMKYHLTNTFMEGYSFASTGLITKIAECCGLFKYHLSEKHIYPNIVAPTSLKKFAIKGNAKKEQMHDAFMASTGINLKAMFDITRDLKGSDPCSDCVDAYFLSQFNDG